MRMIKRFFGKVNNRGFSLVELICAVAIMGLVGASVAGVMVISANSYSRSSVEVELQQEAQLLANQVENLVQNAITATVSGDSLTIEKVVDNTIVTYVVTFDSSTKTVKLTFNGKTQTLAENINAFMVDANDFSESGRVIMNIGVEKASKMYAGSYTVASRNIDVDTIVNENNIKINSNDKMLLEPLYTGDIVVSITGATRQDGVTWELIGASDPNTIIYRKDDPSKSTVVTSTTEPNVTLSVDVGRDETAATLRVLIQSNQKKEDGLTPAAQKVVTIYVRRVTGFTVTGAKTSGTDLREGAVYSIDSFLDGYNLGCEPTLEAEGDYISPYTIKWSLVYSEDGADREIRYNSGNKSFYNDFFELKVNHNDMSTLTDLSGNPIGNGAVVTKFLLDTTPETDFTLTLKKHISYSVGDVKVSNSFQILGEVMHTGGLNKAHTLYSGDEALGEVNYYDYYLLKGNSGLSYDGIMERGTDNSSAQFDWGYLKQELEARYHINQGAFSCERIWRYREITSLDAEGNPKTFGNWCDWMLSSSEYGNAINLRKETLILDSNKRYEVEIKWQIVYTKDGNKYIAWPYSDTPKSKYSIEGAIMEPVMIKYKPQGMSVAGVGSDYITVKPGEGFSVNYDSFSGIYGNHIHLGDCIGYKIQRYAPDSDTDTNPWKDADTAWLQDCNLWSNASNNYTQFGVKINRKGNYRVLVLRKKMSTGHYDYGQRKFIYYEATYDDSNNALYDEASGRGIFYFTANESTYEWKSGFAHSYLISGTDWNTQNVKITFNEDTGAFKATLPKVNYTFTATVKGSYTYQKACDEFYAKAKEFLIANADAIANP